MLPVEWFNRRRMVHVRESAKSWSYLQPGCCCLIQGEAGSCLTELSVCDMALRHLVRPTELHELAAVGSTDVLIFII